MKSIWPGAVYPSPNPRSSLLVAWSARQEAHGDAVARLPMRANHFGLTYRGSEGSFELAALRVAAGRCRPDCPTAREGRMLRLRLNADMRYLRHPKSTCRIPAGKAPFTASLRARQPCHASVPRGDKSSMNKPKLGVGKNPKVGTRPKPKLGRDNPPRPISWRGAFLPKSGGGHPKT